MDRPMWHLAALLEIKLLNVWEHAWHFLLMKWENLENISCIYILNPPISALCSGSGDITDAVYAAGCESNQPDKGTGTDFGIQSTPNSIWERQSEDKHNCCCCWHYLIPQDCSHLAWSVCSILVLPFFYCSFFSVFRSRPNSWLCCAVLLDICHNYGLVVFCLKLTII